MLQKVYFSCILYHFVDLRRERIQALIRHKTKVLENRENALCCVRAACVLRCAARAALRLTLL